MSIGGIAVSTKTRTMIVTGASSGIGASLSRQAAAAGYAVLLVARRAERLAQVAAEIRIGGGTCEVCVADVTSPAAPERILDAALRAFARIDVIVHNAGVGAPGTLLAQSDAAIEAQWQLHVAAPLRLSRLALPYVRASHGGLVFFGSGLARVPAPGFGAYCTAKAAIRAAAMQLRRELRDSGIFITYVDPGAVDTEFSQASGMQRTAGGFAVKPDGVAKNILRGIEHRASRVNAVPWQTAGVVLAEWLPALADWAMSRVVDAPSVQESQPPNLPPPLPSIATPVAEVAVARTEFERALEPVERRMERVKMTPLFLRGIMVPGATLDLPEVAMRWAGMPNKNERAAMHEVLQALATAGYLESSGDETWTVVRAAD